MRIPMAGHILYDVVGLRTADGKRYSNAELELARQRNLDPTDKIKQYPLCGAQCQMQARKGKCAICESPDDDSLGNVQTCSDGIRRRGGHSCAKSV